MPEVKPMAAVIRRYEITDEEWEQIKPYIPEEQETPCWYKTRQTLRVVQKTR
jgi:hypothetical protein